MGETTTSKRTYTDEQRRARAEYQRRYRRDHPDAARRWRDGYILRRAAKLQAEGATVDGGSGGGH
jgi:hypothetical protein